MRARMAVCRGGRLCMNSWYCWWRTEPSLGAAADAMLGPGGGVVASGVVLGSCTKYKACWCGGDAGGDAVGEAGGDAISRLLHYPGRCLVLLPKLCNIGQPAKREFRAIHTEPPSETGNNSRDPPALLVNPGSSTRPWDSSAGDDGSHL
jgi:hypothetical protein